MRFSALIFALASISFSLVGSANAVKPKYTELWRGDGRPPSELKAGFTGRGRDKKGKDRLTVQVASDSEQSREHGGIEKDPYVATSKTKEDAVFAARTIDVHDKGIRWLYKFDPSKIKADKIDVVEYFEDHEVEGTYVLTEEQKATVLVDGTVPWKAVLEVWKYKPELRDYVQMDLKGEKEIGQKDKTKGGTKDAGKGAKRKHTDSDDEDDSKGKQKKKPTDGSTEKASETSNENKSNTKDTTNGNKAKTNKREFHA
jgi:hypothetical protein